MKKRMLLFFIFLIGLQVFIFAACGESSNESGLKIRTDKHPITANTPPR